MDKFFWSDLSLWSFIPVNFTPNNIFYQCTHNTEGILLRWRGAVHAKNKAILKLRLRIHDTIRHFQVNFF